jgi:anti-anti-sigma regulatory factor
VIEIREERGPSTNAVVILCPDGGAAAGVDRGVDLALRLGHTQFVVDLGERHAADAELLSVLHRSARRVREAGGRFAVVCADSQLRRLFDLTLLSQSFLVYANSEDALAR